nr:hypothetical protein [Tanacetum cinerariifolium]
MISNEFAVKLCLEHKDDVKPGVVLGRSFMRLTKGIVDFRNGTVTIYLKLDPFLDSSGEEEKIGKNSRNKRKQLEKCRLIFSVMGPSLSTRKPLTQEEAKREALAIDICRRYSLLKEERPVIETMAYSDKYKKILNGIYKDKMKLDGEMKKKEEEAIIGIKGEALIEKEDPGAFELGRGEAHNVNRGITMFNHSKAEPMRFLKDVICQHPEHYRKDHQTFQAAKTSLDSVESDSDDKEEYAIQRNKFGALMYGPKPASEMFITRERVPTVVS